MKFYSKARATDHIIVGNRLCQYDLTYLLEKYDNNADNPYERDATNPKFIQTDYLEDMTVEIYTNDALVKLVGVVYFHELPEAEKDYWVLQIENRIKEELENGDDNFTWHESLA